MFQTAKRTQSKLRMSIDGPAGSGKTFTALRFAHALAKHLNGKVALIDTERGSASKYVGDSPDGIPFNFDVVELQNFSPDRYTEAIQSAGKLKYSVLVVDSLSHAWEGIGGALEMKMKAGESWNSWRTVTPIHNRMVDAMLQSPCHIITTMRSRMEYVQEQNESGRTVIRKVGMSPIQRPGMEYEFDILCDMDWAHILTVSKSRCTAIADLTVDKPGAEFIAPVIQWLTSGDYKPEPKPVVLSMQDQLNELLTQYGPDNLLVAAGKIPETLEEIEAARKTLQEVQP